MKTETKFTPGKHNKAPEMAALLDECKAVLPDLLRYFVFTPRPNMSPAQLTTYDKTKALLAKLDKE